MADRVLWFNGCLTFDKFKETRFTTFKAGCGGFDGDLRVRDIISSINPGLIARKSAVIMGEGDSGILLRVLGIKRLRGGNYHSFGVDDDFHNLFKRQHSREMSMQKRALGHTLDYLPQGRVGDIRAGKGEHLPCKPFLRRTVRSASYSPVMVNLILSNCLNNLISAFGSCRETLSENMIWVTG